MKSKRQFPRATPYTDRHGRRRWRYRKGAFSRELGTAYGTEEFRQRYEQAECEYQNGKKLGAGTDRTLPGSVDALIGAWYKSPAFRDLSDSTKKAYRSVVEPFRVQHATKPASRFERRHAMEALAIKADTPGAANNLRKRLIQIFDHAVALEWIKANPVKLTKAYRLSGDGFHTWDEGEIARFFQVYEPGTLAHRAVTLMLYTGAARSDAVKLGWRSIRDDRIEYRRQKTLRSNGVLVSIPIHPDLAAVLETCPRDRFTFLETEQRKGRSADGLGNAMRDWCNAAGLPECSAHGLRKACARRLAEAGATTFEIMSVTGHKTVSEVERYTTAACREGMADEAMQKLLSRPNREQTLVNLPQKFAKDFGKSLKKKGKS